MSGSSLYIHVPFCTHKCGYCHFYVIPPKPSHLQLYQNSVIKELIQKKHLLKNPLKTVYFGGGTPSLLPASFYKKVLDLLPIEPAAEITLEANPESLTADTCLQFQKAGINRLSIGVQAFQDKHLKLLERTHSSHIAYEALLNAKASGFDNLTLDLMFDLPGQTFSDWEESLNQALSLPITHIALYNLTLEPHTGFYKKKDQLQDSLPSSEISLAMLEMAVKKCELKGFKRYELAAFAKEGFESKHNIGYWTARPFLGLGPSAFSYWEGARFRNQMHFHQWIKGVNGLLPIEDFREKLSSYEQEKELFALQLRLINIESVTSLAVIPLVEAGWIQKGEKGYLLTEKGKLFHDTVAAEIMAL